MKFLTTTIVVLMLALQAVAQEEEEWQVRGYSTSLDLTRKDSVTIRGGEEVRVFKDDPDKNRFTGSYRSPMDLTGGHDFHIFPNGKFIIIEFGDISASIWIATGSWKVSDGVLTLAIEEKNEDLNIVFGTDWLIEKYGDLQHWRVRALRNGEFLGDPILLPGDLSDESDFGYRFLARTQSYFDWEARYDSLIEQVGMRRRKENSSGDER